MKKCIKKVLAIALSTALATSLFACGGKQNGSADSSEVKSEYVYIPEYQELNLETSIGNSDFKNGTIYYSGYTYDEEDTVIGLNVYSLGLVDGTSQVIPYEFNLDDNILGLKVDSEGNIVLAINRYIKEEGEEIEEVADRYFLVKIDSNGNEIFNTEITDTIVEDDMGYIQAMEIDKTGKIVLVNAYGNFKIFDSVGNYESEIENQDYIGNLGKNGNGDIYATMWGTESVAMKKIDIENKEVGDALENLPTTAGDFSILSAEGDKCILNIGNKLYLYDTKSQKCEEILNWLESNIDSDKITTVNLIDDDNIVAIYADYDDENAKPQLIKLKKTLRSEVPEKIEISFGCMYLDTNVKKAIINFNKNSDKYKIVTKEYYTDDYYSGLAKFSSELATDNKFDIVDFSNLNIESYASKGILEDLYTYIEKDETINLEDYYENIAKVYEYNNKLYAIPLNFSMQALIGKSSIVGEEVSWTLDEMLEKLKNSSNDMKLTSNTTNISIMNTIGSEVIKGLVDWEKGECNFDSEEFIKLLEVASDYPSEDEIRYDEDIPSETKQIKDEEILLTNWVISSVEDVQALNSIFEGDITYKGFPSNNATKLKAMPTGSCFAILSKSENKEAAWEFIKYFLSEEYQTSDDIWDLPILKSAFDKRMEEAMKPMYVTNENGEKVEEVKNYYNYGDVEVEVYAATQEDVDNLKSIVEQVDTVESVDMQIVQIIEEEVNAYFSGQKTAKEVADIIQSRVTIYVNETK